MWTPEEEKQLSEAWMRAEAKRRQEMRSESARFANNEIRPEQFELPPENLTPSYPFTGGAEESSSAMLRRANSGTSVSDVRETPLTDEELGIPRHEFDALRPERQLAIANAAHFRRAEKK